MDFEFTKEEIQLRNEVEDFILNELPPGWVEKVIYWPGAYGSYPQHEEGLDDFCKQFTLKLGEKGWLSLSWAEEYGGKNSIMKQAIVDDILNYYRAPATDISQIISAPTILQFGSEEMKKKWIPQIAAGKIRCWLAYSEPNSGSDIGSLKTMAVEDGDDLVINGQKIWSTGAHDADYAWMVVRTDTKASKHQGITLLLVDNNSPGVTINPIINICGYHSFNEVFFDDVRVSKKNIVGEMNMGFYYLMYALQYERLIAWTGGFKRTFEELVQYVKNSKLNGKDLTTDPLIQNKLAELEIDIDVLYGFYWRCVWMIDNGIVPEIEASGLKLFATELSRKLANTGMEILGLYGQLDKASKLAPLNSRICVGYLDSISGPIGAGTSEIQRSIIATRGLGLPRK